MSSPNWFQELFEYCQISAYSASAPIATVVPSSERLTEEPKLSPAQSPSIKLPNWAQELFEY